MPGLFAGTHLERPVTCAVCEKPLEECTCPRDGRGRVLAPGDQTATVRREKRHKGKVVTTVTGLDPDASDLAELVARLKKTCGAGGTVSGGTIEVQGDHREKVRAVLEELGYRVRD